MTSQSKTIFVRNIPYSITNEQLENKFSDFGPIKQCFLVNDKASGKSRGFGYIKFTVLEDAKQAKEAKITIEGRKLIADFADITKKKKPNKRDRPKNVERVKSDEASSQNEEGEAENRGGSEEDGVGNSDDGGGDLGDKESAVQHAQSELSQKDQNMKYHKAKIVVLTGLPANMKIEELNKCLIKMGVKQLAESRAVGQKIAHLKFKCIRDAKRAIRKLHNHPYKDSMLQAVQMSQGRVEDPQSAARRSRVIVRNLSFKCNEEGLRKAFQHCGEIIDIKLPTNTGGQLLGFGFVQFQSLEEAARAVEQMNNKKILGRPVAVDWALPKAKYQSVQQQENNESDKESDDRLLSAESEVSSDEEKQKVPSRESNSTQKRKHEESDDEGLSPCDSDEADDDEDEDVDKKPGMEYQNQMTDESESDADNDGDTDDEEEDDKSSKKRQKKTKAAVRNDTDDRCTVFIRNLSFDTTEDGLHKFFSQFGALQYAKVVINQNTEHSKGMGFVRFKEQDSADKCLAEGEAGSLSLDGRQLILSKAVSREAAAGFKDDKEKEKKDNRNLYLAREGLIRPGTQAAEGLSKADLDKRIKVEELKRHKLKNINIFISPLRLCVRNIPATVDDQQLRKIFKDAAGGGNVNECRIMRDRARVNAEGKGKSMGFAFIAFTQHEHALAALRHTNNNPDIFGDKKRLIVEFSQENRKALEIQAKRRERIQSKQSLKQTMKQEMGNARRAEIGGARRAQGKALPLIHMADKDRPAKGEKQPKGLPSHWGPKIRHKARPSQELATKKARQERKQGRGQRAQKREAYGQTQAPKLQKQRRGSDYDQFDNMVNKYKNNIMAKKKSKWFE
ncbi:RNA-binding protein 28-like isoform X3 [Mya arenaria]|uniref:RNA-binding protein 28-like isoform X3 n=1 Tax=Mya arenaria TaxID=6604 RepID=UPI0022E4E097|nr:RNA-binding protein 28-like isoform X3 [Mya arenaria]